MNHELVFKRLESSEAIDAAGVDFLMDRGISNVKAVESAGVASFGGLIYFGYQAGDRWVGYKSRQISDKRYLCFKASDCETLPFFNQRDFLDKQRLIITEGEMDALALLEAGSRNAERPFEAVVSLSNGAGGALACLKANYAFVAQFNEVYVCFDNDEPGIRAAEEVKKVIPPSKYRRMVLRYKDANEWLINEEPDYDDLLKEMRLAKKVDAPFARHIREYFTESSDLKIPRGVPYGIQFLDNALRGMRRSELTLLTAQTGAGKSTFCLNVVRRLLDAGEKVWLNSYEMDQRTVARKLIASCSHYPCRDEFTPSEVELLHKHFDDKNLYLNPSNNSVLVLDVEKQLETMKYAYDVDFAIFDHLDYIHYDPFSDEYKDQKEVMRRLHEYALKYEMCIFVVAHSRKVATDKEVSMADIKGASSISQYADSVLILNRMSRIDMGDMSTKISVCKNRLFGKEGFTKVDFDPVTNLFKDRNSVQELLNASKAPTKDFF